MNCVFVGIIGEIIGRRARFSSQGWERVNPTIDQMKYCWPRKVYRFNTVLCASVKLLWQGKLFVVAFLRHRTTDVAPGVSGRTGQSCRDRNKLERFIFKRARIRLVWRIRGPGKWIKDRSHIHLDFLPNDSFHDSQSKVLVTAPSFVICQQLRDTRLPLPPNNGPGAFRSEVLMDGLILNKVGIPLSKFI